MYYPSSRKGVIIMTIGITGATGQLGRLAVKKLREKTSEQIVAIVRSPQKAADLGVAARQADYDRPETLEKALVGIDMIFGGFRWPMK